MYNVHVYTKCNKATCMYMCHGFKFRLMQLIISKSINYVVLCFCSWACTCMYTYMYYCTIHVYVSLCVSTRRREWCTCTCTAHWVIV